MGRIIILANVHVCVLLNFCKLPWTQMNSEFWRCGLLRTIEYSYKCGTYLPYKILQAVLQFKLHSSILSFLSRFYFSIAMLLLSRIVNRTRYFQVILWSSINNFDVNAHQNLEGQSQVLKKVDNLLINYVLWKRRAWVFKCSWI